MLKRPKFWTSRYHILAQCLRPIAYIYQQIIWLKCRNITPLKAGKPVICIGNATVGGTGKTPVAIAVGMYLRMQGLNVAFLSRGYGGSYSGCMRVDFFQHHARVVGDEPLLLSRVAPVFICQNRAEAAKQAVAEGADILVMDDGLQHPYLHKDLSIMVVDGQEGFGNGYTLPAGPLREPLASALGKVDAVITIGKDHSDSAKQCAAIEKQLQASLAPADIEGFQSCQYIAFAGIGRPEKFFSSLEQIGINPIACKAFPDHYYYSLADLKALKEQAEKEQAILITTEKDYVRLPELYKQQVVAVPVMLEWAEGHEEAFGQLLDQFLRKKVPYGQ